MKTTSYLPSLFAGACLLFAAGCTVHEHAYVSGGATVDTYDYDYYPAYNVYYYPRNHVYYWNDGGRWTSGRRLPPHYELREAPHEQFHAHSRQPWVERERH